MRHAVLMPGLYPHSNIKSHWVISPTAKDIEACSTLCKQPSVRSARTSAAATSADDLPVTSILRSASRELSKNASRASPKLTSPSLRPANLRANQRRTPTTSSGKQHRDHRAVGGCLPRYLLIRGWHCHRMHSASIAVDVSKKRVVFITHDPALLERHRSAHKIRPVRVRRYVRSQNRLVLRRLRRIEAELRKR